MGISNSKQAQNETNVLPPSNPISICRSHSNEERSEQFILIWLDGYCEENSLDTLRTKTLFRQLSDRCLFFNRTDLFLNEIGKIKSENKKILVIVSGLFAKEILPKTKEILSTIIIFCRNSEKYKHLLRDNLNIIDICTEYETLKHCIHDELPTLKFNLFANQKLTSLRSLDDEYNNTYFSYMLFINFLKNMPQTKQAKEIMLDKCKDFHRRNEAYLKSIEIFRNTYTPNQAINWYVQDSFVYRLVNRAFRTEDVTLWYLFRYYITDLCTQLESVHKEQNIRSYFTLYRGQSHLPTNELDHLKSNIGGLVSTNGFLSASKEINTAKEFILDATDSEEYKVVIFEIFLDAENLKNTVFVDVDQYSGIPNGRGESEILFNIGSVFQILSVDEGDDFEVRKIRMKATDADTHSIKERIDRMQKKYQNGNINLFFGRLLLDMRQYTKAESYFQMMSHALPKYHKDLPLIYDHLGDLNMRITNWNEALKHFIIAYKIKKKRLAGDHPDLGVSLNNLGNYYKAIGNYADALKCYEKALTCQNNQYNQAITKLNMSSIALLEKEYQRAFDLSTEAREMFDQNSSSSSIPIIQCQGIIGNIYFAQKDYDIAQDFYLTAFEMSRKYLTIDDPYRITSIKALADVYQKQEAIEFCLDQLSFYEQYLTENHINVAHLLIIIAKLYEDDEREKISYLERALKIMEENIHLQYATTAECLMMIGNYFERQNENIRKAKKYYIRALELQKRIYPEDYPLLSKTQDLIDNIEN
jgi:tetratricopeptide (TPR) repeat protein